MSYTDPLSLWRAVFVIFAFPQMLMAFAGVAYHTWETLHQEQWGWCELSLPRVHATCGRYSALGDDVAWTGG